MSANTAISWAHHTFNPWWGCEKVSPACAHCYAESFSKRVGQSVWGDGAPRRFFGDAHWNEPRKWDRLAGERGVRERVFTASMADVLEDRDDLVPHRARLCRLIEETPNLDWMLLTKRPESAERLLPAAWFDGEWPQNCWFGITAEDQPRFQQRIVAALNVPAPIHFVSCEPLLGRLELNPLCTDHSIWTHPLSGLWGWCGGGDPDNLDEQGYGPRIDLVLAGGESGGHARPPHPQWFRDLRDQCVDAGVAFHFKQWGEWRPLCDVYYEHSDVVLDEASEHRGRIVIVEPSGTVTPEDSDGRYLYQPPLGSWYMQRVGKKKAGRELDGRTWDQMPEAA